MPEPVDITNWRTAPHSRWAFHNVDRIIPCATIAHDPARVRPLLHADQRLRSLLTSTPLLKFTSTDALVVLHDGRLVFERYRNGAGTQTAHILMSATKAIIGLLVGILQARGDLDIAAPIARHVPEIAGTPYRAATIRDLIDMRMGVDLAGEALAAYQDATNWNPATSGRSGTDLRSFFSGLAGPEARRGGPFSYLSANTDLLGWVLERATGETVATLLSTCLWRPMGAEADAVITLDRNGLARCAGGLCAAARDLARIGQLMIDGGTAAGEEIVPEDWVEDICSNGDPEAWRTGEWGETFAPISRDMRYRSGWYTIGAAPETLFAMGIHGQNLFVDRANRLVVAKLSSWPQPIMNTPLWLTHKAFSRLQRTAAARRPPGLPSEHNLRPAKSFRIRSVSMLLDA